MMQTFKNLIFLWMTCWAFVRSIYSIAKYTSKLSLFTNNAFQGLDIKLNIAIPSILYEGST